LTKKEKWAAYMREYRKLPEQRIKTRERQRKWLAKTGKNKEYSLRFHYNLSVEVYNKLLASQDNVCLICKQPEIRIDPRTKVTRQLAVDHDHKTGEIRGLLCGNCNGALGFVNDNVDTLLNMIEYLRKD
jgi:hypothetical protein